MAKDPGQLANRSLQLAIIIVFCSVLWLIGSSYYLRLIDRAAIINAESTLSVLEKYQYIYCNLHGNYAGSLDELSEEITKLKEALDKSTAATRWEYSISTTGNTSYIIATRKASRWSTSARTKLIREIGSAAKK